MRIALPPAIDAAAFAACDPALPIVDLSGQAMGTGWHVRLVPPRAADPAPLRAAIVARLNAIVAQMSQWEPDSALSAFNRAPAGRWISLPPDFAHVVQAGLAIAARTDGAFDPAMGRIVDLWGFGAVAVTGPPDPAMLAAARAVSGWQRLDYDSGARRLRQPGGLALDLSGIAKGFAVDAVADLLTTAGVRHCLVEIGGELAGRGIRPDGEPWWVDLESPPGTPFSPIRVALHGLAVATSGDYRRGAHTIDPRTGSAIVNGIASVSVLHPSAMHADAWATALGVSGPAATVPADIAARILWTVGGTWHERITPALAAMLADA